MLHVYALDVDAMITLRCRCLWMLIFRAMLRFSLRCRLYAAASHAMRYDALRAYDMLLITLMLLRICHTKPPCLMIASYAFA